MLFTVYMNDLPNSVSNCNVESYVDDTKLYLSFTLLDLDSGLAQISEDLQQVAGWCCLNKLLINPGKTKFMLFGVSQYLI